MLVTLTLLIHEHDLCLAHLSHHSNHLLLSAQQGPQLLGPMNLFLFFIPLPEQLFQKLFTLFPLDFVQLGSGQLLLFISVFKLKTLQDFVEKLLLLNLLGVQPLDFLFSFVQLLLFERPCGDSRLNSPVLTDDLIVVQLTEVRHVPLLRRCAPLLRIWRNSPIIGLSSRRYLSYRFLLLDCISWRRNCCVSPFLIFRDLWLVFFLH